MQKCLLLFWLVSGFSNARFIIVSTSWSTPGGVVDGSRDKRINKFRQKLRYATCHLKQSEPCSAWHNAVELTARELKKGANRKMVKTGVKRKLWDKCLELESHICFNTAIDIFMLSREAPKTVMSGATFDISQYCEHGWYDWAKFWNETVSYWDNNLVLGSYLRLSMYMKDLAFMWVQLWLLRFWSRMDILSIDLYMDKKKIRCWWQFHWKI